MAVDDYRVSGFLRRIVAVERGGPGSGHHGHKGRPGKVGGSLPSSGISIMARPLEEVDRTWLSTNIQEFMAEDWNKDDARRIAEWLAEHYPLVETPNDEFYLTPDGKAYNVNNPKEETGAGGHGEVGKAALDALIKTKVEMGEVPTDPLDITLEPEEVVDHSRSIVFTMSQTGDQPGQWGATLSTRLGNGEGKAFQFSLLQKNEEGTAWKVYFLDDERVEHIEANRQDLPNRLAPYVFHYKRRVEIADPRSSDIIALVFENWTDGPHKGDKRYNVFIGADVSDTGYPIDEDFDTYEEAKDYAVQKAMDGLNLARFKVSTNIDYEEAMAAFGFIRVSRGGSGGSQVGMTMNQYLGPTPAQARYLREIAKDSVENGGEVAWQAGRASGVVDEWPSNEFTAAMQGQFAVRSVYDLPAWAQRVLIQRGGPGSGHHGHRGRPGKVGGSLPGTGISMMAAPPKNGWKDTRSEYETKLTETYGEVSDWNNWENAIWIASDGRMLAPLEDHEKSAMTVLGWGEGVDRDSTEYSDRCFLAVNRIVEAGIVRYNVGDGEICFDIPGRDETTDEQRGTMAAMVALKGKDIGLWPDVTIHIGGPFAVPPSLTNFAPTMPSDDIMTTGEAYDYLGFGDETAGREFVERGGPGSGHHGHRGRPGQRGGSAPGAGISMLAGSKNPLGRRSLAPLGRLAQKYDSFDDFKKDYVTKNFHGIYWHLTHNPNFTIDPNYHPTDLSSLAGAKNPNEPGALMVSTDLANWVETFKNTRQYAAQIELTGEPNKDYRYVGRGFGHEIYVNKPETAIVIGVYPVDKALRMNQRAYDESPIQSEEDLRKVWDWAQAQKPVARAFSPASYGLAARGGPNSGHHGHKGRPGKRGGSLPGLGGPRNGSDPWPTAYGMEFLWEHRRFYQYKGSAGDYSWGWVLKKDGDVVVGTRNTSDDGHAGLAPERTWSARGMFGWVDGKIPILLVYDTDGEDIYRATEGLRDILNAVEYPEDMPLPVLAVSDDAGFHGTRIEYPVPETAGIEQARKGSGSISFGSDEAGADAKAKEIRAGGGFAEVMHLGTEAKQDFAVVTDRETFIQEWGKKHAHEPIERLVALSKTGLVDILGGWRSVPGDKDSVWLDDEALGNIVKSGVRSGEVFTMHNHPSNDADPSTPESPPSIKDVEMMSWMHENWGERKIGHGSKLPVPVSSAVTTEDGTYFVSVSRSLSSDERQTINAMFADIRAEFPPPAAVALAREEEKVALNVRLFPKIDAMWKKVAETYPTVFSYRYEPRSK